MRVFVWKSHGEVDVCAAETSTQLTILFNEICNGINDLQFDDTIMKYHSDIEKSNNDPIVIKKCINLLLMTIVYNDVIEKGSGFTYIRNL